MIMVLFGPPGCGKGTQAGIIAKDIEIPHLSTGDMLRDAVKSKTETGLKAASIMEESKLVSHEIFINIIMDRQVVPELLQDNMNPELILKTISPLFDMESEKRKEMFLGYEKLKKSLGDPGVYARIAESIIEITT